MFSTDYEQDWAETISFGCSYIACGRFPFCGSVHFGIHHCTVFCDSVHYGFHHCVLWLRSLWCSPLCSVAPFTVFWCSPMCSVAPFTLIFTTVFCGSVHYGVHHYVLWLRSLWCSPLCSVAPFTLVFTTVFFRRKRIILCSSSPSVIFKISSRAALSMVSIAEDMSLPVVLISIFSALTFAASHLCVHTTSDVLRSRRNTL